MKFKDFYFESFNKGDVVLGKDNTLYIISVVNGDGTYDVVDNDTKLTTQTLGVDDILGHQQDLIGGERSTDAPEVKTYKRPKKLGKPEKVKQISLF